MNIKIDIINNIDDITQNYKYSFNNKTKVKDLLVYLYRRIFNKEYDEKENLYMIFSFLSYEEIKGILDYNLKDFLDNFNFDYNDVKMKYYEAIGGYFDFGGIARMEIHEAEQNHIYKPHIHIYKLGKRKGVRETVLISLKSLKVIKSEDYWKKVFKSKERKKMLEFLKLNQEILIDAYNQMCNGRYLPYEYYLDYFGKELKIEQRYNY